MGNFSVLTEPEFLTGSCMFPWKLLYFGYFGGIVPAETRTSCFCGGNAGPAAPLVSHFCATSGHKWSCHVGLPLGREAVLSGLVMVGWLSCRDVAAGLTLQFRLHSFCGQAGLVL